MPTGLDGCGGQECIVTPASGETVRQLTVMDIPINRKIYRFIGLPKELLLLA